MDQMALQRVGGLVGQFLQLTDILVRHLAQLLVNILALPQNAFQEP